MKACLVVIPLLVLSSCVSTQFGYGGGSADSLIRDFPVNATPLDINVTYASEMAKGSSQATVILGLIRLGQSDFAFSNASTGALAGLPLIGGDGSDSVENAAMYNVLSKTKSDVLGFPLFTKRVTNYYLWKTEEAWVRGYPGKVSRGAAKTGGK
jgi:hypothetical protein